MQIDIILFLQEFRTEILNSIFLYLSSIYILGAFWVIVFVYILLTRKNDGFYIALAGGTAFIINTVTTVFILKNIIDVSRPYEVIGGLAALGGSATSSSFPSFHVASMFTLLFVVSYYYRRFIIPGTLFAFLVAFSRLYNGLHWPVDIIAGALLGLAYGYIGVKIIEKFFKVSVRVPHQR